MKKLSLFAALIALASPAFAEDGHKHDKAIAGPKGGKVVEVGDGHAEFFVQPDRKVLVTFFTEDMKAQAPAEQVVTLVAEAPAGKAKIGFEKTGEGFISTQALPEGEDYRIVLQIKPAAEAKTQNFRIDFVTASCGECKLAEYACTCPPGAGHEGHAH